MTDPVLMVEPQSEVGTLAHMQYIHVYNTPDYEYSMYNLSIECFHFKQQILMGAVRH